jgi:hypothetical protein
MQELQILAEALEFEEDPNFHAMIIGGLNQALRKAYAEMNRVADKVAAHHRPRPMPKKLPAPKDMKARMMVEVSGWYTQLLLYWNPNPEQDPAADEWGVSTALEACNPHERQETRQQESDVLTYIADTLFRNLLKDTTAAVADIDKKCLPRQERLRN